MRIGNREFDVARHTYVMGILNVTPDSFSDGGSHNTPEQALVRAEEMIREGADILDIGGESTRPGYTQIAEEEEMERTIPVIERIKAEFDVPVSIDTYKPGVAKEALRSGADMVNDIWGLKYEGYSEETTGLRETGCPEPSCQSGIGMPGMAEVIAQYHAVCCLMHNRKEAVYQDFLKELKEDLRKTLQLAADAGIPKEQILLDPGVGFGKSYENNLEAIYALDQLKELGCPVLLGTSRKSVIGLTLSLPVEERLEGTLATTVYAVLKGCAFVRVHDIKENVRAIKMAEAIVRREV